MNLTGFLESFCAEASATLVFQRNRCMRSRFSRSGCQRCIDSCSQGALHFDNGTVLVDETRCTDCLACTAACPTGGLSWQNAEIFQEIVAGMSGPSFPVLACSRNCQAGHGIVPCLGLLSSQHLLYLGAIGHGRFQLDGRHCGTCTNGFVLSGLKKNLADLAEGLGVPEETICRLITDDVDLKGGNSSEDRRHFLGSLKRLIKTKGQDILAAESGSNKKNGAFGISTKDPDGKTELLNNALDIVDGQLRQQIIPIFRHEVRIGKKCNYCGGCAAICPNGALKASRGKAAEKVLQFETSACCGCNVCVGFCRRDALEIQPCGNDLTVEESEAGWKKLDGGLRCLD